MTLTRRHLVMLAAAVALAPPAWAPPAWGQTGDPVAFVNRSASELIAALDNSPTEAARRQALQQIVDRTVDDDGIGRFCLGRFWRLATPAQQQQYLALFHRTLMISITARLGDYKGVKLVTGRTQPTGDGTLVASTVTRPGQQPVSVGWLIGNAGGTQKVIDVVAEGTSLRQTQRSDYTSYLEQHGDNVQALIDGLQRQAAGQS